MKFWLENGELKSDGDLSQFSKEELSIIKHRVEIDIEISRFTKSELNEDQMKQAINRFRQTGYEQFAIVLEKGIKNIKFWLENGELKSDGDLSKFSKEELSIIKHSVENDIDISRFTKSELSEDQMKQAIYRIRQTGYEQFAIELEKKVKDKKSSKSSIDSMSAF